jgi:TolA-binding protein
MAKRKTPKVKDLRPETITKEELQKLQGVVKSVNEAQMQLGVIETQKHNLLHEVVNAQQMIDVIRKELISTYGDHEFNILDGSIKYNENGNDKTDTKDNGR